MDGRIIGVGSTYTSKLCNAGVGLIGPAETKEYFFVSCYIDPFMLPLMRSQWYALLAFQIDMICRNEAILPDS